MWMILNWNVKVNCKLSKCKYIVSRFKYVIYVLCIYVVNLNFYVF